MSTDAATTCVTCANRACAKSMDLAKDVENVLCPLCASPDTVYCSEACRMVDWVGHKCDNAFLVSASVGQKSATLFVPYHFEDTLDAKEQKQWLESLTPAARIEAEHQHYLLQVKHPDQSVSQHLVQLGDPLTFRPMDPKAETVFRRGREPRERVKQANFRMVIQVTGVADIIMEGNVDAQAIYKNHAPSDTFITGNKVVEFLLNRRKESADTVLFVRPKPTARVQVPTSGNMRITVDVNGARVTTVEGPYKMRSFGFEFTRAIGKFLNPRLKALFPTAGDNIKDFKMLRGTLGHTEFILIFEVPRHKKLRNVAAEENIMFFRGLVYQVSADKLEHDANLLPLPGQEAAAATQQEASPTQVNAGKSSPPPPPPRAPAAAVVVRQDDQGWGEVGEARPVPAAPPTTSTVVFGTPPPPPPDAPAAPAPPPPMRVVTGSTPVTSAGLQEVKLKKRESDSSSSTTEIPEEEETIQQTLARHLAGRRPSLKDAIFSLRCDASDVSQMVGLAMALELRERDLPPHAVTSSTLVRNHARALLEKRIADPSVVPMDVSAAVYSSIQALHELPMPQ